MMEVIGQDGDPGYFHFRHVFTEKKLASTALTLAGTALFNAVFLLASREMPA